MSKRDPLEFLKDIIVAIDRINEYVQSVDYKEFCQITIIQDSSIRNIEIIGEAAKQIPEYIRAISSEIPWKEISGTRDKLIHDYFGVNLDILWSIIKNDLGDLKQNINQLISDLAI